MRFVHFYLAAYCLLLLGALIVLWQAGVLGRLPPGRVILGLLVAIGLAILLALTSRPPVHPA
jgi:hypothetical protein